LPAGGRPDQVCSLIGHLGWKQLHGGGLSGFERQGLLAACGRPEESVVTELATVSGLFFTNDPQWAMQVLTHLKPNNEFSAAKMVEALGRLAEEHAAALEPELVAQCLGNVGELCFSEQVSDERNLDKVARAFPKQVYELAREVSEPAEGWPAKERRHRLAASLSLGPIRDPAYTDREISEQWEKAASAETESFAQANHLALIRSLLWADGETGLERLRGLIAGCNNGNELKLVTNLAATRGSRFAFTYPDIVRLLLALAELFLVADAVRETLWLSACGGGRSYTEHQLDPEYRYILEQGEALANRYRDDAVLEKFYRMVAESERHQMERNKRAFPSEEDLD
jgi:hypothetical protein